MTDCLLPDAPAAKAIGIVIDPYRRSVTATVLTHSDAHFLMRSFAGGTTLALALRKHDGLYVHEDTLRAMAGSGASRAGFSYAGRIFMGYGLIIARRINILPRPYTTADEVAQQTTWLDTPAIHAARLLGAARAANSQTRLTAKEAA